MTSLFRFNTGYIFSNLIKHSVILRGDSKPHGPVRFKFSLSAVFILPIYFTCRGRQSQAKKYRWNIFKVRVVNNDMKS